MAEHVRQRARLRDVAARAGVSPTTASFVLNDRADVKISDETRERVRAAAADLQYRPHHVARSLTRGRSNLLGLLVADMSNPYNWEVATAADHVGFPAGYGLVVFDAQREKSLGRERIDRMLSLGLDGVLITHPSAFVDYLDAATRRDVVRALPAVCCGGSPNLRTNLLPGCYVDGLRTGYIAARHLLDRGHRRISFLGDRMPWTDETSHALVRERPRWQGYRQALEEADIPDEPELLLAPCSSDQPISEVLRAALGGPRPPTAIVAFNDLAALGAYRVLAELGRRVPDDVAIVGVDDVELAAELHPPLTSVSQCIEEATTTAARMLLRMIDDPAYRGEVVHLEPRLRVRGST